jgi:23S rRNA pseudouridine1911/1915/1917 synthase
MKFLPENISLLYEDRSLVVVDKPAGLLTIATESEKRRTVYAVLFDQLRRRRPPERLFIVHRLDREASGLLVFAKTESAKLHLQDQFKDHSAHRTYRAVTEGRMTEDTRTLRSYLAENAAFRCYSTRDQAKGKLAITHVRVIQRTASKTHVEVELETGRKHQIRVHLAELGHPIVGDPFYGNKKSPIRRLALHGIKLCFKHPVTEKNMEFESPPPANFSRLL